MYINNSDGRDAPKYPPDWGNYLLKQQYELAPYYALKALRREAKKQHLNWHGREEHQKTWMILCKIMKWPGSCLTVWGEQFQKRYGISLNLTNPVLSSDRNADHDGKRFIKINTSNHKFPWLYLILAYGLTWIFWIPIALTGQNYQQSHLLLVLMFLGVFGPGFTGICLTYREQGSNGWKDYWHRVFDFRRVSIKWYTLIFLLFPALHFIAIGITKWLGGSPPDFAFVKETMSTPTGILMVLVLYLVQAGLEELGWRGYMLDRLQEYWKPLSASLILGVVHMLWHLPTFWIIGTNQSSWKSGIEPLAFIGFVVAGSIYSSWCYNDNRRSILSTILLHAVGNLSAIIFVMAGPGKHVFTILLSLSAVVIAVAWMVPSRKQNQVVST